MIGATVEEGVVDRHRHAFGYRNLLVVDGASVPANEITVTPRIGITRSAEWPLRWFVTDSPYVSKTPPTFPRRLADR